VIFLSHQVNSTSSNLGINHHKGA